MGSLGPTTYLPGDVYSARGEKCQKHKNVLAVKVLVGETDRMGSETIEMCQQCYEEYRNEKEAQKANPDPSHFHDCASCGTRDATVKPTRDPDEGMSGPLYYWCAGCRKAASDYHAADLDNDCE